MASARAGARRAASWVHGQREALLVALSWVWWAVVLTLVYHVGSDVWSHGVGVSNSKVVSILDSTNTCFGTRRSIRGIRDLNWDRFATPSPRSKQAAGSSGALARATWRINQVARRLWYYSSQLALILVSNTLIKFGPATLVSLAIDETPVLLKGPRHYSSFLMSLLLVQLSPDDVVYRALGTPVLQAVLAVAVSLYKLRKACFLVQVVGAWADGPWVGATQLAWWTMLMVLVLDGTALARQAVCGLWEAKESWPRAVRSSARTFWHKHGQASGALLFALLAARRAAQSPSGRFGLGPLAATCAEVAIRWLSLVFSLYRFNGLSRMRAAWVHHRALRSEGSEGPGAPGKSPSKMSPVSKILRTPPHLSHLLAKRAQKLN